MEAINDNQMYIYANCAEEKAIIHAWAEKYHMHSLPWNYADFNDNTTVWKCSNPGCATQHYKFEAGSKSNIYSFCKTIVHYLFTDKIPPKCHKCDHDLIESGPIDTDNNRVNAVFICNNPAKIENKKYRAKFEKYQKSRQNNNFPKIADLDDKIAAILKARFV